MTAPDAVTGTSAQPSILTVLLATLMSATRPSRPAKKPRLPNLETALKAADRAGCQVKGAAIYVDRVEITFGQPDAKPGTAAAVGDSEVNEWDRDLGTNPPSVRQ
jgi:hypothetical protein